MGTDVEVTSTVVVDRDKVVRLASTALALLEDALDDTCDVDALRHLSATWARLVVEIGSALSDEALEELGRLIPRLPDDVTTIGEMRVLEAQLVGWLDGLLFSEQIEPVTHRLGEIR